ncbi:MAG: cupin domain-containing protein [Deltaproteobacteria bacterium]
MDSPHVFHLLSAKPQDITKGGTRTYVDISNFPVLKGMAVYRLLLNQKGVREPHWHPNANELAYCLKGDALVTVFGNLSKRETFTVSEGQMFYVPSGYLHHIENMGRNNLELILAFSDEEPEDFGLSASLGCMTDAVLGNTWGLKGNLFSKIKRSPKKILIGRKKSVNKTPEYASFPSQYKFDVEGSNPLLDNAGGSAKVARKSAWPVLENLSMYSLRITNKGMREPHWHPVTAEMGYVNKGKARMTLLSPRGDVDTYKLEEGDVYFIPRAYPHHIENIGGDELHFLVFFDQNTPGDIGFSAGVKAYSNEVLGATFNTDPASFKILPDYHEDLLIVSRINRRD